MEKQVARLKDEQTELSVGPPWRLVLQGDALPADRLLEMDTLHVSPAPGQPSLFTTGVARLRSGDRVAIMGRNGGGKSSLLRLLWQQMNNASPLPGLRLHPRLHPGYYDQTLAQLPDEASLLEALTPFAPSADTRKRALIAAGFGWARHSQKVSTLSGASDRGCCSLACRWRATVCCCWMNPPTILIWRVKRRWRRRCAITQAACCWSVMTAS